MPWNWSNPEPSNQTPAAQTAGAHLQAPDIGHLVAAILHNRAQQQQQEQQGIQNMMSGLSKGIAGIKQNSDLGNLADYENLSMNGQTKGSVDQADSMFSDMSGMDKMRAIEFGLKQRQAATAAANEQQAGDMEGRLKESQIWKNYNSGGGDETNASAANALRKSVEDAIRSPIDSLNDQHRGDFDKDGNWVPNEQGSQVMLGPPHKYSEKGSSGFFGIGKTPDKSGYSDYANVFPQSAIDRMIALRNQYQKDLGIEPGTLPGNAGRTYPSASLAPGQKAPGVGEDGRPIPGATASSVTPAKSNGVDADGRAGSGPTDYDIAYLRSHPESAKMFEARFGQPASSYLENQ